MLTIAAFAISIISLLVNIYLLIKVKKINDGDEVKRSWSRLSNPNSYESKQLRRNTTLQNRR